MASSYFLPRAALLPRRITASSSPTPALTLTRLFSSTPNGPAQQRIPPESPLFINVPNPPQDQSIEARRELKRVRGFLPVPRRIFSRRGSEEKCTKAWLARATPRSKSESASEPPANELQAWRRRMAEVRRQNIRTGVRGLWTRKLASDARRRAAREANFAANHAAAIAPEREDERLTRSTINAGTLQTTVLPDPLRFERGLESAARTAAVAARKSEARRDALQTLYMNARSFIVTEEALEAFVEQEFADDHFESMGQSNHGFATRNIWDAQGEPMSTAAMLSSLFRKSGLLLDNLTPEQNRTILRQKRVAEVLTGGQMDETVDDRTSLPMNETGAR